MKKNIKKNNHISLIPLGGLGEIGKNMTAIEYGDEIIIVDAGISFPTDDTPGIDMIIPDITYLKENKEKIKAILLTHGHEDHIGAMPYLLKHIDAPVYASKLTIAFVEYKLIENKIDTKCLHEVKDGGKITIGKFKVEFIKVSHSISGALSLAISTPIGLIYHTGDFKIDFTPVDGDMVNLNKIAEIGKKGVLLLMADSTNVEREGYTLSEKLVGKSFDKIFNNNRNDRIIIATFSSNIHRLQQIINACKKYNRKVALFGRSLIKNSEIAIKIGELTVDEGQIIEIDDIKKYPDNEIVIVSTGSQGEPMSALTRMSTGDFKKIKIQKSDTIIISSTPIPGNEKAVYNVINNLYRKGANVIYESLHDIHVSGHACKEELKLIHSLIKPKFFIPVHGEYRHLKQHAQLAVSLGMSEKNIIIPKIGNRVEIRRKTITINGTVPSGSLFIDGANVGDTDDIILSDRKRLSEDGIFILLIELGENSANPDIIVRGLQVNDDLLNQIKEITYKCVSDFDYNDVNDRQELKRRIRKQVRKHIWFNINKSPMIIPFILDN